MMHNISEIVEIIKKHQDKLKNDPDYAMFHWMMNRFC